VFELFLVAHLRDFFEKKIHTFYDGLFLGFIASYDSDVFQD
jgi:hypothetical protein